MIPIINKLVIQLGRLINMANEQGLEIKSFKKGVKSESLNFGMNKIVFLLM